MKVLLQFVSILLFAAVGTSGQYHTLTDLGQPNPDATLGNPMRGLAESPRYTWPPYDSQVPLSLEFYYVGLDEVMIGNPDVVGPDNAFNWGVLDDMLTDSASRGCHAIFRIICHFPGRELMVPQYLIDAGVTIVFYNGNERSPHYGDETLLNAFRQFIEALADRYDGNKQLAFLQAGLLGFWGEWHTNGQDFLPRSTMVQVADWYRDNFATTKIQLRYPDKEYRPGFGLHDDSFAFSTLDGEANGGVFKNWYFWPRVQSSGVSDFWRTGPMGAETRPEIQDEVFEDSYPARTFERQDFMECVEVTHATYSFHHKAFKNGGFVGTELANALSIHARMGYNYYVQRIEAFSTNNKVSVAVTVRNIGVAPFYYPLSLEVSCPSFQNSAGGVENLITSDDLEVFTVPGFPADPACLSNMNVRLRSEYIYPERPMKFAQNDGTISFSLPLPGIGPTPPASTPQPIAPTTQQPVFPETPQPVVPPTPVAAPTLAPVATVEPPVFAPTGCSKNSFQGQCTNTASCKNMYNGATDCKNSEGGVCYCGNIVCGCLGVPPSPPAATPIVAPTPLPPPSPMSSPTACSVQDFQGECSTTWGCQNKYTSAFDCKNSVGGVCFCTGNVVCGCQA